MCENNQLDPVLDTLNRILDISEKRVELTCDNYKASAEKDIKDLKTNWQKLHNETCADMVELINNHSCARTLGKMKNKYMSNIKVSK